MNDLRTLQLAELEILKEIKRVCEKNDIRYFLIGGTLLGAVRTGKFIPWDDDIDIGMLREDFDKFERIANSALDKKYFFQTPNTDEECGTYCCGRVRLEGSTFASNSTPRHWKHNGIFVDILPYDKVIKNKLFERFFFFRFNVLSRVYWKRLKYNPHPSNKLFKLIMNLSFVLYKAVPTSFLKRKLENYHKKYTHLEKYDRIELLNQHPRAFKAELVEKLDILQFEGIDFPIPKDFDNYLTNQYGEWRTLPPVEQQIPHHLEYSMDNIEVGNRKDD